MKSLNFLPLIAIIFCSIIPLSAQTKEEEKKKRLKAPPVALASVILPIAESTYTRPNAPHSPITITVKNHFCLVENHPASNYSLKIFEFIKQEIKALPKGAQPYILIVAPATHAMDLMNTAIREAARAGIRDINFATKSNAKDPNRIHFLLSIRLPKMPLDGEQEPSELAPMFIRVDNKSTILINTGPDQEALDSDPNIRTLPQLEERLQSYRAAATAGGKKARIELYCDSDASYQRFIDLLQAFERQKIHQINFRNFKPKKRNFRNPYDKRLPRPLPRPPVQ